MKNKGINIIIALAAVMVIYSAEEGTAGEIIVIASPDVQTERLERKAVSNIYLGKKVKWKNGDTIRIAMLKKGETHEWFAREIVGTTPAKLKKTWMKVIFSGKGTPPKVFSSEAALVKYVAGQKGAIGYVDASTAHGTVRKLVVE